MLAHGSPLEIPLVLTALQDFSGVITKVKGLASRVALMDALFEAPPGDIAEQRHRDKVIRYGVIPHSCSVLTPRSELEDAEGQLRSLSKEPGLQWHIDHTQHNEDVVWHLEEIREAIFCYQVCS